MRVLLLDIPAPCKWINSNSRLHRMETAKLTAIWRNAGTLAVTDENRRRQREGEPALQPFDQKVRIVATIYKPRAGRWDPNNYAGTTKALVDGLVSAGLLEDDDHTHVIGPDHRHGGKGEARVILRIEEAE
jgi:hypothetical protein